MFNQNNSNGFWISNRKLMKRFLLNNRIFTSVAFGFLLVGLTFAQTSVTKGKRNSPFAPNPKGKVELAKASNTETPDNSIIQKAAGIASAKPKNEPAVSENRIEESGEADSRAAAATNAEPVTATPDTESVTAKTDTESVSAEPENGAAVKKNSEEAKKENPASASPTEIYKIGVGDILYISLQNAPAKESTYFTVLKDGTIDYPLAGEMVSVTGMTTGEIESVLQGKIKLYEDPQVSVKVREHNSHTYTVLGMVEKPGEKFLQREAYPLLVVRAEAVVEPKADRAIIKRGNAPVETIDLKDEKSEDTLIYPGDVVEFAASDSGDFKQFYYIGGEINSGGQKDFLKGITLTQAILVSGGLKKSSVKKVVIRRKNEAGMLTPTNYDLRAIKDGKVADPVIEAGDTIEIGN